jgi:hypothetical protein
MHQVAAGHVVLWCAPFEIFYAVVRSDVVDVVHDWSRLLQPRLRYGSVYKPVHLSFSGPKTVVPVVS